MPTGVAFPAVFVPARFAIVLGHRRLALGERFAAGRPVATALLPTLVFSLVLAEIIQPMG